MIESFSFHNKYLRHPRILVRLVYLLLYGIFLLIAGGSFCFVIIFATINYNVYLDKKNTLISPYQIDRKAAILDNLSLIRASTLSDFPILSAYVKKIENILYVDISKKLPKDDLFLDILDYGTNHLSERYYIRDCNDCIENAKNFLIKIKDKHSVISGVNLEWKPQRFGATIKYLIEKTHYGANQKNLEELEQYILDVFYDKKNEGDPLYQYRQLLLTQYECAIRIKMVFNVCSKPTNECCYTNEYKRSYEILDNIYHTMNQIRQIPIVKKQYFTHRAIEYIEKQKEYLDNFDKEFCKPK